MGKGIGGHHSPAMGTAEWLTPPHIIRALGPFYLDPCAAREPRPWDTATKHIALPENGLSEPWEGRVWLNPPYGSHTEHWLAKLADVATLIGLRLEREFWGYDDRARKEATPSDSLHRRLR